VNKTGHQSPVTSHQKNQVTRHQKSVTSKNKTLNWLKTITLLLVLCVLAFPGLGLCQVADTASEAVLTEAVSQISGYYKMLAAFGKTTATKEGFFYVLHRGRLEWKPKLSDNWDANVTYDHEVMVHDFGNTSDFDLVRQNNQKDLAFWDADKVISDTDHLYQRHLLYRAYLTYHNERARVTMGKQLIDWGRMRFYSPLDIFNQPLPSVLEPEERVGFDGFNVELFSEEFAALSFVFGPGEDEERTSFGVRGYKKIGTYDLFLIAADHRDDLVFGAGWDGYIKDAGFRGEVSYTKDGGDEGLRAAVGCDYNFGTKTYVAAEYFYNGLANGNQAAFSGSLTEQRRRLTLKKNLIGVTATHELTPLIKLKGTVICDLDGESAFLNPEVRYNVREDLDLAAGAQLFIEDADSEFADYENLYYLETKFFF